MSLSELLLTAFVALIVFGPSKMPMLAKHLGIAMKHINQFKQQLSEFWQNQLNEAQLIENNHKAEKADDLYEMKDESASG